MEVRQTTCAHAAAECTSRNLRPPPPHPSTPRCEPPSVKTPDGTYVRNPRFPMFLPGTPMRFIRLVARCVTEMLPRAHMLTMPPSPSLHPPLYVMTPLCTYRIMHYHNVACSASTLSLRGN